MQNLIQNISEVPKDRKVIVFDLDGTLTESKTIIDADMANLVTELMKHRTMAIIGGGTFERFKTQFVAGLPGGDVSERLFLLPLNGGEMYYFKDKDWHQVYSLALLEEEKERIREALKGASLEIGYTPPAYLYGEQLEDRIGQMTWSALGQDAPLDEKLKWSHEHEADRQELARRVREKLPDMDIMTAGITSIDITRKGIDKKYGLEQLMKFLDISPEDVIFVGDAFQTDGNDKPALGAGVDCFKVSSPADTRQLIIHLLQ